MILFIYPNEQHAFNLVKEIKKVNRKIDSKEFQILIHKMNGDENQRVSTQYDLHRLRDQKKELMTLIENI